MPGEGRGLAFGHAAEERKDMGRGNLPAQRKVQRALMSLNAKAKGNPDYRFYSLYDMVCDEDFLGEAYVKAKENKGSPGIDDESFEAVEQFGRVEWIGELAKELREKRYVPGAVRRVYIRKPNGKMRPLGIPNLKDRVVQTAAVMILNSIFEPDLPEEQYAYRSGKNAVQAVEAVQRLINRDRHLEVIDADLSGYFDTIPHPELMNCLARRVSDGSMLHLLKMWLESAVVEVDKDTGLQTRTTYSRDHRVGTPQGAPISPLYSNLYMREFILAWKARGFDGKGVVGTIVNYADDLVICCKGCPHTAMLTMKQIMGRLKLTVNEEKTRLCKMPEGEFVFLGYSFGKRFSFKKRIWYVGASPAEKSVKKLTDTVREMTSSKTHGMDTSVVVGQLNGEIRGWASFYRTGALSKSYRTVDLLVRRRFRHWLKRKFRWPTMGYKRLDDRQMYEEYGLVSILKLLPSHS
jgi:group II intron reverse transcriptase/maturase